METKCSIHKQNIDSLVYDANALRVATKLIPIDLRSEPVWLVSTRPLSERLTNPKAMSTDGTDPSFKGPNGLASCNIFNNELSLECQCKPTAKAEKARRRSRAQKEQLRMKPKVQSPPGVVGNTVETNPSISESRYEIVKKPSTPGGRRKKTGTPPAVDIFHEKTMPSTSKITLKPLKPARSPANGSPAVDTDEMARLYDKYLAEDNRLPGDDSANKHVADDHDKTIKAADSTPVNKPSKVALFFKPKKRLGKKKDCLNGNILTEDTGTKSAPSPASSKRDSFTKRSLRFLKQKSQTKPVHTEEIIIGNDMLEKKASSSSDPTVASHDSNSIVDTVPEPDVTSELGDTAMDISVFEVFEQYTGSAFPTHHCSPRLPIKQFEINKQAELLSQIEKLQKELSESKGTVQELTQELDEVYSEKDVAVHKLDRLIEYAKMNDSKDEEHEKLREIRMYLTDRTEPTISSITSAGSYHPDPDDYHPFCSCMRST